MHTGGATLGRALPATHTSDAGVAGLACLAQPLQRSAVEVRCASALFRVRTDRKRAESGTGASAPAERVVAELEARMEQALAVDKVADVD